jgi:hypothetical protein
MAENCALQMEMWGKLNPSNRGQGGDGKLQVHSLMLDATEVDVSTTDLAGTIIGRGKETHGAWFVKHLLRLGFTCCSEDLGMVKGTYIHDMLINHLTTPSHRIEC